MTCLVSLLDRKHQVFKIDIFWHFWRTFVHSKCKCSSLRSQCWIRHFLRFSNTFKSCPNNKISRNKKYFGLAAIFLVTWRVRIAYALCSFVVLIFKRQASGCELRQKRRVNFRTSCKKYKTILMLHNNLGKVLYCLGSFYVCQVPIRPPSCQQTNETDHTRNTKSFT